mmetsp:Transcript_41728/g.97444  ORF Transcript_41728/g.97444 Transcript_41728/m.97444 type:complete len:392 (-) Transcript_41728:221-1396(-)
MWIDISDGASQESESIQQEERTALIGQDGTDQPQVVNRDADSSDDDALSTSRRCRFTTGMFLLCVAAAILIFYPDAMAHRHFSKTLVGLEEWEQIPNISGVIKRAEGLDPAKTPRNLRDLFTQYGPYQDGELPWIRTQCVVDAVQASAYLVQAVVFLYRAIDYQGLECPKDTPSGCAVSIAGFIASLSWVASYISLAASSCGDAVNSGALCAADWTALMADFAEVASSGAAVNDCDFGGKISALLLHIDRNRKTHPYYHWEQFLPAGAGPAVIMARKRHMGTMRDFDITQCVVDVTNAAAFLVRATLQVSSHGNNRLSRAKGLQHRHLGCDLFVQLDLTFYISGRDRLLRWGQPEGTMWCTSLKLGRGSCEWPRCRFSHDIRLRRLPGHHG